MVRILGLSGSLRAGSHNTTLLRAAADLLPDTAELTLFAHLRALPPYDEDADVDPAPPAVTVLRSQIAAADALLVATPEYNASVPGVLKNALDWASRPFPRQRSAREAECGDRGEHRPVRRGLGAGGGP